MGDRLGLSRMLRMSLAVFALGSLACGIAQSLLHLIAAHLLQGLGGGPPRQSGRQRHSTFFLSFMSVEEGALTNTTDVFSL